jgi:hypothetical protein
MKIPVTSQFVARLRPASSAAGLTFEAKLKERQEEQRVDKPLTQTGTAASSSTSTFAASRALTQRSLELSATQQRPRSNTRAVLSVSRSESAGERSQFRVSDLFRGIVKQIGRAHV